MSGAMEIKKPVAATVIAAFVGHTVDGFAGGKLLLDAPPSYRQILVTAGSVRRRRFWADGQPAWQ
jgi:hypothetical protein